jgi:ABC-2 type transport system permease protein
MPALINDLNGPLALSLSFFPPTSIVTFALRLLVIEVPWWQVFVSITISLTSAAAMMWLAAKAFRMGMLRYGQRLQLRELFRRA